VARTKKPNIGSDLVRALCDYLALRGHFFWRSNNVGIYDVARGVHRKLPFGSMKGVPDIIMIGRSGQFTGIEAKAGSGRLSPDQAEFGRLCIKNGGEYIVARSIDDLRKADL
jgi:hypothetical protein